MKLFHEEVEMPWDTSPLTVMAMSSFSTIMDAIAARRRSLTVRRKRLGIIVYGGDTKSIGWRGMRKADEREF